MLWISLCASRSISSCGISASFKDTHTHTHTAGQRAAPRGSPRPGDGHGASKRTYGTAGRVWTERGKDSPPAPPTAGAHPRGCATAQPGTSARLGSVLPGSVPAGAAPLLPEPPLARWEPTRRAARRSLPERAESSRRPRLSRSGEGYRSPWAGESWSRPAALTGAHPLPEGTCSEARDAAPPSSTPGLSPRAALSSGPAPNPCPRPARAVPAALPVPRGLRAALCAAGAAAAGRLRSRSVCK